MTFSCPKCGMFWGPDDDGDTRIIRTRVCPDCERAITDHEGAQ